MNALPVTTDLWVWIIVCGINGDLHLVIHIFRGRIVLCGNSLKLEISIKEVPDSKSLIPGENFVVPADRKITKKEVTNKNSKKENSSKTTSKKTKTKTKKKTVSKKSKSKKKNK